MIKYNSLIDKYKDKLVVVDKRKSTIECIQKLVDVRELSLDLLSATHLNFSYENAERSIYYQTDKEICLRFYEVIQNEISRDYYDDILNDTSYRAYFEKKTVYIIADNSIGIIESNSDLIMKNVKIEQGITINDINEKNIFLRDYLSTFEDIFSS